MNAAETKVILIACLEQATSGRTTEKSDLHNRIAVLLGKKLDASIKQKTGSCLSWLEEAGYIQSTKKFYHLTYEGLNLLNSQKKLGVSEKKFITELADRSLRFQVQCPSWKTIITAVPEEKPVLTTDGWDIVVLEAVHRNKKISLKDLMDEVFKDLPPQPGENKTKLSNSLQVCINRLVECKHLSEGKKNQGPYQMTVKGSTYLAGLHRKAGVAEEKKPKQKPSFQLGSDKLAELKLLRVIRQYPGLSHKEINGKLFGQLKGVQKTKLTNESDNILRRLETMEMVTQDKKGWYNLTPAGEARIAELEKHTSTGPVKNDEAAMVLLDNGKEVPKAEFLRQIMEHFAACGGTCTHVDLNKHLEEAYRLSRKVQLSKATARELLDLVNQGYLSHKVGEPYVMTSVGLEAISPQKEKTPDRKALVLETAKKYIPTKGSISEITLTGRIAEVLKMGTSEVKSILKVLTEEGAVVLKSQPNGTTVYALPGMAPELPEDEKAEMRANIRDIVWRSLPITHDALVHSIHHMVMGDPQLVYQMFCQVVAEMETEGVLVHDKLGYAKVIKPETSEEVKQTALMDMVWKQPGKFISKSNMEKMAGEDLRSQLPNLEADGLLRKDNGWVIPKRVIRSIYAGYGVENGIHLWKADQQNRAAVLNRVRASIVNSLPMGKSELEKRIFAQYQEDEHGQSVAESTVADLIRSLEQDGFLTVQPDGMVEETNLSRTWKEEWEDDTLPLRGNDILSFQFLCLMVLESLAIDQNAKEGKLTAEQLSLFITARLPAKYDYIPRDLLDRAIRKLGERNLLSFDEADGQLAGITPTEQARNFGTMLANSSYEVINPEEAANQETVSTELSNHPLWLAGVVILKASVQNEGSLIETLAAEQEISMSKAKAVFGELLEAGYVGMVRTHKYPYEEPHAQTQYACTFKAASEYVLNEILKQGPLMDIPSPPELTTAEKDKAIVRDAIIYALYKNPSQTKEQLLASVTEELSGRYTLTEKLLATVTYSMRTGAFDHRLLNRKEDTKEFSLAAAGVDRFLDLTFGSIDMAIQAASCREHCLKANILDDEPMEKPSAKLIRLAVFHAMAYQAQEKGMSKTKAKLEKLAGCFLNMLGYSPQPKQIAVYLDTAAAAGVMILTDGVYTFNKKQMALLPGWFMSQYTENRSTQFEPNKALMAMYIVKFILRSSRIADLSGLPMYLETYMDVRDDLVTDMVEAMRKQQLVTVEDQFIWLTYPGMLFAGMLGLESEPDTGKLPETAKRMLAMLLDLNEFAVYPRTIHRAKLAFPDVPEEELRMILRSLEEQGLVFYNEDADTCGLTVKGCLAAKKEPFFQQPDGDNTEVQGAILRMLFFSYGEEEMTVELVRESIRTDQLLDDRLKKLETKDILENLQALYMLGLVAQTHNSYFLTPEGKSNAVQLFAENQMAELLVLQYLSMYEPLTEAAVTYQVYAAIQKINCDMKQDQVLLAISRLRNSGVLDLKATADGAFALTLSETGKKMTAYTGTKPCSDYAEPPVQKAVLKEPEVTKAPETTKPKEPEKPVAAETPYANLPMSELHVELLKASILRSLHKHKMEYGNSDVFMDRKNLWKEAMTNLSSTLAGSGPEILDLPIRQLLEEEMLEPDHEHPNYYHLTDKALQKIHQLYMLLPSGGKPMPDSPPAASKTANYQNAEIKGYFALRKVPRPMVSAIYNEQMLKVHNQKYSLQSHWTFQPNERDRALKWAGVSEVYMGTDDADYAEPVVLHKESLVPKVSILEAAHVSRTAYTTLYVQVVRLLSSGLPMRRDCIVDMVIKNLDLTEGSKDTVTSRIAWIISYLGTENLIATGNPGDEMILMTTKGKELFSDTSDNGIIKVLMQYPFFQNVAADLNAFLTILDNTPADSDMELRLENEEVRFKSQLINRMQHMDPFDFEVLILSLIQKMGYGEMVPNKIDPQTPGDEGVDGMIRCDEFGFRTIYTQAKRWSSSVLVGRQEVQKFVGALEGKNCSEGIFITTSHFTDAAIDYVNKISRFKIALVDGTRLADLMVKYKLGFTERPAFTYREFDENWWENLKNLY